MELSTRYEIEADLTRELAAILDRWRRRFVPGQPLPDEAEQEEDERRLFLFFIVALAPIYYTSSRQILDEFHGDLPQGSVISHRTLQQAARAAAEKRAAFVAQVMAEGTLERAAEYQASIAEGLRQAAAATDPRSLGGWQIVVNKALEALAWEFSQERAEMVAITETTAAQFGGQQIGRAELAERGVILDGLWVAELDEKVCPVCLALDGKDESDWPEKYREGPPAHVNCRCHVFYEPESATIPEDVEARFAWGFLKAGCGANAPGGGGFQPGNTCGRDGGTAVEEDDDSELERIAKKPFQHRSFEEQKALWDARNKTRGELQKPDGRVGDPNDLNDARKVSLSEGGEQLMRDYIDHGRPYETAKWKGQEWVAGKRNKDLDQLFDETQRRLDGWEGKYVKVYRGVKLVPGEDALADDIIAGKVGPGSILSVKAGTFESWSTDVVEARGFASRHSMDKVGIVLERYAPKNDAVMVGKLLPETIRRFEEGEWVFRNARDVGQYRIAGVFTGGGTFVKADP